MKSKLFASTALALVLSAGAAFAGPTATITDAGDSNVSTVTQNAGVSAATDATITQRDASSANQAYITQAGAGENNGTIDQAGAANYANVSQDDVGGSVGSVSLSSTVDVKQDGNDIANVTQGGGHHHDALITQGGAAGSNRADVSQNGNNIYAYIDQVGDGNYANFNQSGAGGVAASAWQSGSLNHAYVTQTGAGFEYLEVTQAGTAGLVSASQGGDMDTCSSTSRVRRTRSMSLRPVTSIPRAFPRPEIRTLALGHYRADFRIARP